MSTPIGAIAGALEMFAQSMQSTTGVSDPALGRNDPSLRSGVAIKRIQDQSHAGTSNYRDNYVRSLRHDARVLNSLLYPIYGIRPGRLTRMVTGEGEAKLAMIGAPPAGAQMPQTGAPQANGQPAEPPKVYTLTPEGARHNIAVKVSKNYDTRRQEEAAMNAELIQAIPSLMTIGGDLFFKSQDSPGAKQWAERMKTMLDPKVLAVINKQEGVQPPSPEVQAQMQQMQMQMQGMGQQLQEAQSQLQTDALKVQSDQAIAQFKAQTEKELAFLKAQTDKELLAMKLENDRIIAAAKLDREVVGSREAAEHAAQLQAQKAAADIERQLISQQSTGDEGI